MSGPFRRNLAVVIRLLFLLLGLVFLTITFRETWSRSRHHVFPSGWSVAGAAVLGLLVVACAGRSWASLLSGRAPTAVLARTFYTAQLGKYIPGTIWQAVGQINLAQRAGVATPLAVTAFPVHAITQACAGGTIGAGLVFVGWDVPGIPRIAALSGLLLVPLLRRHWMVWVLNALGRVTKRTWSEDLVPAQRNIVRSFGWATAALLVAAVGFTLIGSSVGLSPVAPAVPAFALAWTAGFLALPFPSGIGVREAVLIGILGHSGGAAPLIGASIAHRLAMMAAEVTMIAWGAVRGTRRLAPDRPAPPAGPT